MTKLCPRGKAAAKRKFKVYPSAYANAYASKICAGKAKDPSGVRRKDFKGPKPSSSKVASAAKRVRTANKGAMMKKNKPIKAGKGMLMPLFGLAGMAKYMQMNKKKRGTVTADPNAVDPITGSPPNQNSGMQQPQGMKRGGIKPKKAGLGLMMLMNHMKKMGKKQGRAQAAQGEAEVLAAQNAAKQNSGMGMSKMNEGGYVSGSYIQDEYSETNSSTKNYYKDMLD
tara:strand:+ start:136 stop:813 length:678 start_codon:yes stop_codon:yes gene_type:complete